jgi:thiamine transport system ATP-binding protein
MLEIRNITYKYGNDGDTQLYSYDLDAHSGEVVGILGESGSGKSTLLDIIAGFLPARSGSILLDAKEISGLDPASRPVSILFQNNNLFEHMTSMQNVLIGIHGKTRGSDEEISKATEILSSMGILNQIDRPVSKLSGGQQQRVALARVLLRDKPILLLDEPFSGLDHETRVKILHLIRSVTDTNKLHTIMVTHEKDDCKLIADDVYVMKNRKLEKN